MRLHHVHSVSSYNAGDSCTIKTEIISIQFQLLIFMFPLRSRFFNFFPFPLLLMELNSIRYWNESVSVTINLNHNVTNPLSD